MDETLIGIFFSISNPFETKITNLIFAIYTYIRSLYLENLHRERKKSHPSSTIFPRKKNLGDETLGKKKSTSN